jgi:hypothetical protein
MFQFLISILPSEIVSLLIWLTITFGFLLLVGGFIVDKFKLFSNLPNFSTMVLLAKILGLVLVVLGVWFKGSHDNEMIWKTKAAQYEERVKLAEAKANNTNTILEKETQVKVQRVKDVQIVIQEKVQVVEKIINEKCEVDPVAIELLNNAVKNEISTPLPLSTKDSISLINTAATGSENTK